MRISDWSSDVCSSDLKICRRRCADQDCLSSKHGIRAPMSPGPIFFILTQYLEIDWLHRPTFDVGRIGQNSMELIGGIAGPRAPSLRSEEHTSELQSLMRISYAVFCLKKKKETQDAT